MATRAVSDPRRARELTSDAIRGADRGYTAFHAPRYAFLLRLLRERGASADSRILDIGTSKLTTLLREVIGARVDTLGFDPESTAPAARHFHFDQNRSQHEADWRRDLPAYDFVVMAEVIEHLYTAPQLVLRFVRTLLADDGRLVLQTPNAASLTRRVKLLAGRNPYEMIRLDPTDPGHFREYTVAELTAVARAAGLRVEHRMAGWYFDARYGLHGPGGSRPQPVLGTVKNVLYRLLPGRLQGGITMVLCPDRPGPAPAGPARR